MHTASTPDLQAVYAAIFFCKHILQISEEWGSEGEQDRRGSDRPDQRHNLPAGILLAQPPQPRLSLCFACRSSSLETPAMSLRSPFSSSVTTSHFTDSSSFLYKFAQLKAAAFKTIAYSASSFVIPLGRTHSSNSPAAKRNA